MKKSRFTEKTTIANLHEAEADAKVCERCRRDSVSEATFYNWTARYGGTGESQPRRPKEL